MENKNHKDRNRRRVEVELKIHRFVNNIIEQLSVYLSLLSGSVAALPPSHEDAARVVLAAD